MVVEVADTAKHDINIKNYTLCQYAPAKLLERTLEVIYKGGEESPNAGTHIHGQEKCNNLMFPFARSAVAALPIKAARRLVTARQEGEEEASAGNIKEVLELTLDISNTSAWDFQPGDTVGILPCNSAAEVQEILQLMQLENKAHHYCQLQVAATCTKKNAKVPPHIPQITTPLELLRDCLNVRAVLKKQFLRTLADCCSAVDQSDFLACLSAKEGSSFYNELILEKGLTLLELLQICKSCKPTLEMLAEHLPRLLPRPYSIANSHLATPNEIRIIFSIQTQRPGVTTQMMQQLAMKAMVQDQQNDTLSDKILTYLRDTNKFRYTAEDAHERNQILISVGTGLAPFLGFLEHKQQLAAATPSSPPLGETWLFAGAATAESLIERDHLIQLKTAAAEGQSPAILNRYFESLSRVPDAPFQYVQQQLQEHAFQFTRFFFKPETILYVCADGAQISKSIEAAIKACLAQNVEVPENVPEIMAHFKACGKYREDVWT